MARREPTASPGFRRRLPLELTAPELELLEQAEARFGTKRATLVAGLEALASLARVEAQLEESAGVCERAVARSAELDEEAARLRTDLEKVKADLAAARKAKQSAQRKGSSASDQIDDLARALTQKRDARTDLEDELAELEADLFEALHCPRCGTWAPPSEWASRTDGEREYVYHRSCGYHTGGILDTTSVFGFRAAH